MGILLNEGAIDEKIGWQVDKSGLLEIGMNLVQNLLASFCSVLAKDTSRHFPLLGGLDKQFLISLISTNIILKPK